MLKRPSITTTSPIMTGGLVSLILTGCAGSPPTTEFGPCPSALNCVSSAAQDEEHIIGSLRLGKDNDWACLLEQATLLPGESRVMVKRDDYARIEYTSSTMGIIDDLELKKEPGTVHVRSASRAAYRDFGSNRQRVMALYRAYKKQCLDAS